LERKIPTICIVTLLWGRKWPRDWQNNCEVVVSTTTEEYGRRSNAQQIKNEMGGNTARNGEKINAYILDKNL
jgi:hypothetical protein